MHERGRVRRLGRGEDKVQEGPWLEDVAAAASHTNYCHLGRFKDESGETINAKHQCGYCSTRAYFYCETCFADGEQPTYAICHLQSSADCGVIVHLQCELRDAWI